MLYDTSHWRTCFCVCDRLAGVHPPHGEAVWLPVRTGAVQVASLVTPTDGEAEDHLGLQDPVPGRAVSSRRRQDPVCGRWPGQITLFTLPLYKYFTYCFNVSSWCKSNKMKIYKVRLETSSDNNSLNSPKTSAVTFWIPMGKRFIKKIEILLL